MSRLDGAVLLACLALGCNSDSRKEPPASQMCEELAAECADLGPARLDECARIGERGVDDPTREDQCFVYYDSCIHECRFLVEFGPIRDDDPAGPDASPDQSADAGNPPPDAGSGDAAAD